MIVGLHALFIRIGWAVAFAVGLIEVHEYS